MKRKRGHKKGKSKKRKSQSPIVTTTAEESPNNDIESVNSEENNSGSEEEDNNKMEEVSKLISEPVIATATAMPVKSVESMPVLPKVFQRPTPTAVYGRVKLKLKTTPKPPPPVEPQAIGSSVGQVQSDGVKNSEVVSVVEKKDDKEVVVSGEKVDGSSKKSGVIKIVSSKSLSPPALGGVESGKVVSLKSSSPLASAENENESGKVVALKSSSPPASAENESGKVVCLKSSSPLASAESEIGKVVSLKSSSPLASAENESGKVVSLKSSSPLASAENDSGKIVPSKSSCPLASGCNESGKIASLSSPAVGGNGNETGKAVFVKNSSPPVSVSIESGNAVSLKSSSIPASGDKESGKIVFSKSSSPPSSGGKESGKIVIRKSSSPPTSGGGKIVIRKSSSPPTSGGGKIVILKSSSPPALDGKESGVNDLSQNEEKIEEYKARFPQQEAKYNKEELEASLEVIQKIMKMDAAEPFNVPVDPIGLGIPDYFGVIDTPMDFGTIRSNLESGKKYMDSEDVYNDVQYIWDNCSKYNNKGDYIVDLMKRVKKNFMNEVVHQKSEGVQDLVGCGSGSGVSTFKDDLPEGFTHNPTHNPTGVVCEAGRVDGRYGGSWDLDGELNSGGKGFAKEFKYGGRLGDFGDGFTGGGRGEIFGKFGGGSRAQADGNAGGLAMLGVLVEGNIYKGGGNFEKGGAGGCGSGGGPGCWFAGEIDGEGSRSSDGRCGAGGGKSADKIESSLSKVVRRGGDFSGGFTDGGILVGRGPRSSVGSETEEWWNWLLRWPVAKVAAADVGLRVLRGGVLYNLRTVDGLVVGAVVLVVANLVVWAFGSSEKKVGDGAGTSMADAVLVVVASRSRSVEISLVVLPAVEVWLEVGQEEEFKRSGYVIS
uniref:Bromo domain-containing protein n=1 Tax=Chenopodium quinoa TaxID=63459 RepID=A0A803N4Y9_CHEQI